MIENILVYSGLLYNSQTNTRQVQSVKSQTGQLAD